jgi:F-type H+-transporting ATPase subunit gamma
MPGLKEVRTRISSINSTKQITSAMKMVSASKLKRAQNAIVKMRPYVKKLREILQNLSANCSNIESVFIKERKIQKVLIVVITSNRGLCGAFNANVIKSVLRLVREKYAEQEKNNNLEILCLGKKGADFFVKRKYPVIDTNTRIFDSLNFNNALPIAESIMNSYAAYKYDVVEVIYNQFKNAGVQVLTTEQFLPVEPPSEKSNKAASVADYIFEPNQEKIVEELIPKSLKIQFYKLLLDSSAAEHGARMTAMHKATDNADNLLKELKLSYNKARQASITKEILEIVGGAEALKG